MSGNAVALSAILRLCQNERRRIVLGTLLEEQRSLTLNDLAKAVLKHTQQKPITDVSEDLITRIRLSLYHLHLPMLASEGLIDYDRERELVEPTERLEQVRPTLSAIIDADTDLETPMTL